MTIDFESWKYPITDTVMRYACAFDLNYHKSDNEIISVFKKTTTDKSINERIHLINASYHTRVPVDDMTENIIEHKNLDEIIRNGDSEAVEKIACCGDKHYFVFATKYCCFSNMKKYPIYDSLSAKVLQWFNDRDGFADKVDFTKIKGNRGYEEYRKAVDNYIKKYKLELEDYKMLDKFLWLVGKNMPDRPSYVSKATT